LKVLGIVKYFDRERRFAFVKPDDGGRDIFVHQTALVLAGLSELVPGQFVFCEIEPPRRAKGPKAVRLELRDAAE
jgi:CspA family cold shock protein